MRSSRIFRSVTIWASAAAVVGSITVASIEAQSGKSAKKSVKTKAAAPAITGKLSTTGTVLKTSFGEVPITEFEAAFRRMNAKEPYATTLDSLLEFLDVYADYRLKLQDAKESGLFDDPKIQSEIAGYREMLAGPFVLEKELVDPAVASIYERRRYEINASHFLAKLDANNLTDTAKAYAKAMRAISMLNNGDPMSLVVMNSTNNALLANGDRTVLDRQKQTDPAKYTDGETWEGSDDRTSQRVGGSLGYFTGGMTVRPFEEAAYDLPVGTYTRTPVRSKFGYHVIQVYDKKPRIGGVKVSHILVQLSKLAEDTTVAWAKADSIYKVLKSGADFATIAREASEDKTTRERGGDMDYINHEERRADPAFDAVAYSLKDGEISAPVRTGLGYHIIRRNGTLPMPTFEKEKDMLKQMYKRYYYEDDKKEYIANLQKKFGYRFDHQTFDYFLTRIDTTRTSLDSTWSKNVTAQDRSRVIYTLNNERFTVGAFVDSLNADPGSPLARIPLMDNIARTATDHSLRIGARELLKKYPDFEVMMQDYQNGIILFELENQRVWSKAVPDSAGVRKFYNDNKAKFLFPERVDVSEIFILSDSLAKSLYKRIMAGESFDDLARQYTERPGFKEKAGRWGLLQKDENEIAKKAFNFVTEEIKEPFRFQAGYSIVRLNKRVPAMQKTFDEARQEAGSQYQEAKSQELRKAWVDGLRKKYNRKISKETLVANWKKHNADKAAN